MLFASFGHSQFGKPSPVDKLLSLHSGPLDNISTKMVLSEFYDVQYGIYNHDADDPDRPRRPLALVAMHPKENPSEFSALYRMLDRFAHHQIYEKFGLNLEEFLSLPREMVERIFHVSAEKAKKDNKVVDAAMAQLQDK